MFGRHRGVRIERVIEPRIGERGQVGERDRTAFIDCLIAIRRGDRGATLFTVDRELGRVAPPLSSWT